MSTTTDADHHELRYRAPDHQLTFGGLIRAELIKLVTARSLVVVLFFAVLLTAGAGILAAALTGRDSPDTQVDPIRALVNASLLGMQFSIILVAVLGAVAGACDFTNGTIHVFFAAAPRRNPVLVAKLTAVGGAVTGLVGASLLVTYVVNWVILTSNPLWTPFMQSRSVLSLLGALVALAGVTMCALSLGCLLRSSAGAVFAILGLLIVMPVVLLTVPAFPGSAAVSQYSLGGAVTTLLATAEDAGRWSAAVAALTAWALVLAGCAAASMRSRDV